MDILDGPGDPFATVNGGFGVDFSAMNRGVTPIFFTEPVKDERASEESGAVTFRDEERVRIIVAGDMLNQAVHPVDDGIRERFADAYAKWQANKLARHIDGIRIEAWPLLSKLQVAQFQAVNILSVENLRDLSDANCSKVPDGREWREKARAWLESAKDGAAAARYAAENERLHAQMDEMREQMADMAARLPTVDEPARRGPGRPPKVAA